MPTSAAEGREWVYERIRDTNTPWIIDAGAGEGTYSTLARHTRLDARWVGLEIYEPYVDRFLLGQKYDDVLVTDARYWQPELEDGYTILFGDVVEHMPKADALHMLAFHISRAQHIMISVPIINSPQGKCFGNEHEAHLHQWTFEEMSALIPDAESWRGKTLGRWWWTRND